MPTRGLFSDSEEWGFSGDMEMQNRSIRAEGRQPLDAKRPPILNKSNIYNYLVDFENRPDRQYSSRWKNMGSCRSRCCNCSMESARSVTWPTLRPGRGDFPYKCKWASGKASSSLASVSSPIRFSIAENPRARVTPSGRPETARRWFSNWLVTAPSMVQWPELWTRGGT